MVKQAFWAALTIILSVSLAWAETISIPAGTMVNCRLLQTLSTKLNFQGDPFTATVTEAVEIGGQRVIPTGAILEGRILGMRRPGRIKGVGEMRLSAEKITFPDGRSFNLSAELLNAYGAEGARVVGDEGKIKGPNSRKADLKEIGGGMAAGGVVGTIFGGLHGTVVGATVGGVVGLADRLRRRGEDLTLPSGTQLNYQLTRELVVQHDATRESASRLGPDGRY
jgi:type IV secretion system protein VirB10